MAHMLNDLLRRLRRSACGNFWRDIYLAIGTENEDTQSIEVRLYYKPFVRWIWAGGLLMVLGGLLGIRRSRKK